MAMRLRTLLGDHPCTAALKNGSIKSDLVEFDFVDYKPTNKGFKPMVRESAFDVAELAIVTYLMAKNYNKPMVLLLLVILVVYVTMVYGPIAAWLVELFPARIRYTSVSLPYHIGNGWFGGFLPAISFALVALTGNMYKGLWYPIIVALMTVVIGFLFLPETKDRTIK